MKYSDSFEGKADFSAPIPKPARARKPGAKPQSQPQSKPAAPAGAEGAPQDKLKIDKRKLIIYSEIMKPKFNE